MTENNPNVCNVNHKRTAKKIQFLSDRKHSLAYKNQSVNAVMEIMVICCNDHITLRGHNARRMNVNVDGTYTYHRPLKNSFKRVKTITQQQQNLHFTSL